MGTKSPGWMNIHTYGTKLKLPSGELLLEIRRYIYKYHTKEGQAAFRQNPRATFPVKEHLPHISTTRVKPFYSARITFPDTQDPKVTHQEYCRVGRWRQKERRDVVYTYSNVLDAQGMDKV